MGDARDRVLNQKRVSSCAAHDRLLGLVEVSAQTHPGLEDRELAHGDHVDRLPLIVIVDIIIRVRAWNSDQAGLGVTLLSVLAASLVSFGASYGGSLVYDYASTLRPPAH